MADKDKFFHIEPLADLTFSPPYTMKIQTAKGGLWIHHVDKDGKPAGENWNGIEYEGDVRNLLDILEG